VALSEIIIEKIRKQGPINFSEFMDMALYYPGIGYYNSSSIKIGRNGDYYTSPYASSIFGEMLARQLTEMWHLTGEDAFTIVEYGGGDGILCRDILAGLKKNKSFYEKLDYFIIEKSSYFQQRQKDLLSCEKVKWISSVKELGQFTGCVLANEVVDNFCVHQVEMQEELMEVMIDYNNGFNEVFIPAKKELKEYLQIINVNLAPGFRTEINLQAIDWLNEISFVLQKGFLIIIDYGFSSSELYAPGRSSGTLISYHKHSTNNNFYQRIGEQDITAHVNFSALKNAGIRSGMMMSGFTKQGFFLQALGLTSYLKEMEISRNMKNETGTAELLAARQFMVDMGQKLKVLILCKNIKKPALTGMMFQVPLE
jgi:SAM-dependent MidA family methyltransferase